MAEYIELTEELVLAMRAGARAICNTKKYNGTIFVAGVFSDNPKEMPYLKAAEMLYAASETKQAADVAPVRHGRWIRDGDWCNPRCSECGSYTDFYVAREYCPNCGAKMDA